MFNHIILYKSLNQSILMGEPKYRLVLKWIPGEFPSSEQEETLDTFVEKYKALRTGNEEKRRITLHFSSSKTLERKSLEAELKGFNILDFYEVE